MALSKVSTGGLSAQSPGILVFSARRTQGEAVELSFSMNRGDSHESPSAAHERFIALCNL
jgi:hypothetical protein